MLELGDLILPYKEHCDFLVVYVMEAHAKDEWQLGNKRSCVDQHKVLEDRLKAAQLYRRARLSDIGDARIRAASQVPFALDTMDNIFYQTFGGWPGK